MPIEIVKTKITSQRRYVPPSQHPQTHSSPRNVVTDPGQDSSDEDKIVRRKHNRDDNDADYSKFDSRIDYANDRLRQTMVEIHDIKMYRSANTKKAPTTTMDGLLQPLNESPIKENNNKAPGTADKKRVLVGAEFSRFIVNKELAKADRLNVMRNRFHDPIEDILKKSQKDIDQSLMDVRILKHKTKKMNDQDDPKSLDNQRKVLLEQSEEKRMFGFLHPDKVNTLEEPKPTENYVHFVIDSVNLQDEKKLEKDLLQLESALRKELDEGVDTDTSNDDDTSKRRNHLRERRHGGYLKESQKYQMMKNDKTQDIGVV
jgi:hypothetical protein